MKKWALMVMLLSVVLSTTANEKPIGSHNNLRTLPVENSKKQVLESKQYDGSIKKIAEEMRDTVATLLPEFLDNEVITVGVTYYDMQHNSSPGRNIAVDQSGNVHVSWMYSESSDFASRTVKYNGWNPDSGLFMPHENPLRMGAPAYTGVDRAGYTTIDVLNELPFVAYHESYEDGIRLNCSYDFGFLYSGDESRGSFLNPLSTTPPIVADQRCPEEYPDLEAIWPVIEISRIDNEIHIVATPSADDTIITCDGVDYDPENYVCYYHCTVDTTNITDVMTWPESPVIVGTGRGVSPDIATANLSDMVAIAWNNLPIRDEYECAWADESNIFVATTTDDGATWETTNVTNHGPDHREEPYDTLFRWANWYKVDDISGDTSWYNVDTSAYYTRPSGSCHVIFDNEDYLHVFWTQGYHQPDTCGGDVVSTYFTTDVRHWTNRTGEITSVLSAYPVFWNRARACSDLPDDDRDPRCYNTSYFPTATIDDDGNIYVIWTQKYASKWWFDALDLRAEGGRYFEYSDHDWAIGDICLSYSDDNGATWKGPIDISNTYTPLCDQVVGECKSELDPTIARDVYDGKIYLSWVEDRSPGMAINNHGEAHMNSVKFTSIPTEQIRDIADAFDDVHYTFIDSYPDTSISGSINYNAALCVDQREFVFDFSEGTNPEPVTFNIDNCGIFGDINWSLTEDCDWLDCSINSGRNDASVEVTFTTSSLTPGETYIANVRVISPESLYPTPLLVTFILTNRGTEDVMSFTVEEFDQDIIVDTTTAPFYLNFINTSFTTDLEWEIANDLPEWISFASTSGSTPNHPESGRNYDSVQVSVDRDLCPENAEFTALFAATDANLDPVPIRFYKLRDGEDVEENKPSRKPEQFDLMQNFPNPFNAVTVFSFEINEAGVYAVEVFDTEGKLVKTLVNSYMNAGNNSITWFGDDLNGNTVNSGLYFYRIRDAKGNAITRKMSLVK